MLQLSPDTGYCRGKTNYKGNDTIMSDMTDIMTEQVYRMTNLQKNYCIFRARRFTQTQSASKAGSKATTKDSLARVGYQIEQMDGTKDYIEYLKTLRTTYTSIDEADVIKMMKDVYEQCVADSNLREANKAVELIAKSLGMMGKEAKVKPMTPEATGDKVVTKENVGAFQEEDEGYSAEDQLNRVNLMLKELERGKIKVVK